MSDDDQAFPSIPSPPSPGQGRAEDGDLMDNEEGNGDVSKLAEVPAAKRTGVKRPQPKLDCQRLTSERGLPALRSLFDDVHFKGKGHEAEDLRLLMHKMENWAHRLFPKLQFDEFVDKVERLGKKKEVQTCLKRIRLDMPLTHEDYLSQDVVEEPGPGSLLSSSPDPFGKLPGWGHSSPAPPAPSLSEEQRRRMDLNRQRALQKKLARQQQQQQQQQTGGGDSQHAAAAGELVSITSEDLHESEDPNLEGKDLDLDLEGKDLDLDLEGKDLDLDLEGKDLDLDLEGKDPDLDLEGKDLDLDLEGKDLDLDLEGKDLNLDLEGKDLDLEGKDLDLDLEGKDLDLDLEASTRPPPAAAEAALAAATCEEEEESGCGEE